MPEPAPKELRKWRELQQATERDFKTPLMQRLGHFLLQLCNGNEERIAKVALCLANECIAYESDLQRVGAEDFDEPDNVWRRGVDDCDGKARLFIALCRAADVHAEIIPHWKPDAMNPQELWLSHVSARVRVAGAWQPVELTLKRAQLGEVGADVPKEMDTGKWLR